MKNLRWTWLAIVGLAIGAYGKDSQGGAAAKSANTKQEKPVESEAMKAFRAKVEAGQKTSQNAEAARMQARVKVLHEAALAKARSDGGAKTGGKVNSKADGKTGATKAASEKASHPEKSSGAKPVIP